MPFLTRHLRNNARRSCWQVQCRAYCIQKRFILMLQQPSRSRSAHVDAGQNVAPSSHVCSGNVNAPLEISTVAPFGICPNLQQTIFFGKFVNVNHKSPREQFGRQITVGQVTLVPGLEVLWRASA